jgi:hypothetical protein
VDQTCPNFRVVQYGFLHHFDTDNCLLKKFHYIYSKNEEGKAFVHANCVLCNPSERKRPYSRVLYLVLFDTSLESEGVIHETMTTDIVEALYLPFR